MTVEEQLLLNTLSKECERLHKELQVAEKHIDYLKEDKNQLYTRCDKTARDDFLKGMYGSIRITSISEFARLRKAIENIKAEVNNDMHKAVQVKNPNTDFAFGLQHALDIINKHTKGETE